MTGHQHARGRRQTNRIVVSEQKSAEVCHPPQGDQHQHHDELSEAWSDTVITVDLNDTIYQVILRHSLDPN